MILDRRAAVDWYRKAAAWGRPASLCALGTALLDLATSDDERDEAMDALHRSALAGYADGMYVYASQVVEVDPIEALRWLLEAIDAGHDEAMGVARHMVAAMNPDDVRQADRRTQTDGSVAEALLAPGGLSSTALQGLAELLADRRLESDRVEPHRGDQPGDLHPDLDRVRRRTSTSPPTPGTPARWAWLPFQSRRTPYFWRISAEPTETLAGLVDRELVGLDDVDLGHGVSSVARGVSPSGSALRRPSSRFG